MFEDEEFDFDLDFSDTKDTEKEKNHRKIPEEPKKMSEAKKQVSHELQKRQVTNTQKSMFSLGGSQVSPELQKRQVTNTQKSMFSLDETSHSESEILDISLNYDGGEKGKKGTRKVSTSKTERKKRQTEDKTKTETKKRQTKEDKCKKEANKSIISSRLGNGSTQGTQKSIFFLEYSLDDSSELLDISLNFDRKDEENKLKSDLKRKEQKTRNQNDQSNFKNFKDGAYREQQSKSGNSAKDTHLRPGAYRGQQSTGDSVLRSGPPKQQSKSPEPSVDFKFRSGPSRDDQTSLDCSSRDQQSRARDPTEESASQNPFQGGVKRSIEKEIYGAKGSMEKKNHKSVRRFPGPAGLLPVLKTGNLNIFALGEDDEEESIEQEAVPDLQCSQENANDNTVWIKALDDLGMRWGDPDSLVSKYNVGHIKLKAKPGSSIRMPILVARIKTLDTSCKDPVCRLRDPHGEVAGGIHRDVIEQYGADIQVGSILVLRNVTVLMTASTQYVNITLNNIVSIYRLGSVAHIHPVDLKDMEEATRLLEVLRQKQLSEIREKVQN